MVDVILPGGGASNVDRGRFALADLSNVTGISFFDSLSLRFINFYGLVGTDCTAALQRAVADLNAGVFKHLVIDRELTYADVAGLVITADDVTLQFLGFGRIHTPNLNGAANATLFTFTGTQLADLTPRGDLSRNDWSILVASPGEAQVGDLIYARSDIYFNGIADVAGFGISNKADCGLVRLIATDGGGMPQIRTEAPWDFDIPQANITALNLYRPCRNPLVISPKITSYGTGGVVRDNGIGAYGVTFKWCVNPKILGSGEILAMQGKAVWVDECYDSHIEGLWFDSLETAITTQSYYGVSHRGGKSHHVDKCDGQNIRRVADTDGVGSPAIRVTHTNISGRFCNGSTAGTHHCLYYTFANIDDLGGVAGMTIRGQETIGMNFRSRGSRGECLILGGGEVDATRRASVGSVQLGNLDLETIGQYGINCWSNGKFDFKGKVGGYSNKGLYVRSPYVDRLHVHMDFTGEVGTAQEAIATAASVMRLNNVKIAAPSTVNSNAPDISILGSFDPASPATNILIEGGNLDSAQNNQICLGDHTGAHQVGYFNGETVRVRDCFGTGGSGDDPVGVFQPEGWTCAPTLENNRKFRGLASFTRAVKTMVGRGTAVPPVFPDKTTLLDGDYYEVLNSAGGTYSRQEISAPGTTGTLIGVTATTQVGVFDVVVVGNAVGKAMPGMIIAIAGSGLGVYRIEAVSADFATLTLNFAPTSAVSGAAVSYRNPTWKGSNLLET